MLSALRPQQLEGNFLMSDSVNATDTLDRITG